MTASGNHVPVDMASLDNNSVAWELTDKLHKFKEK
jgi:hypothetical protein